MKTNFLYKNAPPRSGGVFLKIGLCMMLTALLGLSAYAQELQRAYLKLYHLNTDEVSSKYVEINPSDSGSDFSYIDYGEVDTETATLKLSEGDGFHAQLILMNDVPNIFIRFGVSMGDFKRTYTINNGKLYYNWGHLNVFDEDTASESKEITIDMYYNGSSYQVHYNGWQIECEVINDLSGLREAFVSSYGRTNSGEGEVYLSFAPYTGSLYPCRLPVFKCQGYELDNDSYDNGCVVYLDCTETDDNIGCYIDLTPIMSCSAEVSANAANNKLSAQQLQDFTVYPNPAENQLVITLTPLVDEIIKINITDAIGRLVLHQAHNGLAGDTNTINFDITNLNSGIYYVKIDSAYKFETKKVIVIK